ncbi:conserved hypothetical protein [Candidatus Methylobacter favarea]|uniref:DUF4391 domain-containing protein n=1 Tax=Candidatus Methylobacter favarea TaxID=2707345 RepID=A0A8S0Y6K3_9GAMM|nr:DUF4391 domain-containing protein [Candidatus Methylobacter favarea]CAA9891577.1 conserved hypothetical protein [Candidatus Methylobacter favarea]
MIEDFYKRLAIPDTCLLGKRVYKKLFYDNAPLNAADKKAFADDIEDILWRYTLKPETINIARYEDEEREYHEVAVLQVNLKSPKHYKRIAQIIQRAIPYPLLIVFIDGSRIALSIADKRVNRADREKIRVEAFYETDWLDLLSLSEPERAFLESCVITQFFYHNFYAFYGDLTARIIALNCARLSGTYSQDNALPREERVDLLNHIRQKQLKLAELLAALKKESQFNRQLELNMQIKKLVHELDQHKEKI